MNKLNDVLKQPKQIILSIPRDGSLEYVNDDSDSDWSNHYLATITVQYVLGDSYIAFDSECLISLADDNKVTFEQYDTSPDAHETHHNNISDLDDYCYDELCDLHYDHIITDKPDFMTVEWC